MSELKRCTISLNSKLRAIKIISVIMVIESKSLFFVGIKDGVISEDNINLVFILKKMIQIAVPQLFNLKQNVEGE